MVGLDLDSCCESSCLSFPELGSLCCISIYTLAIGNIIVFRLGFRSYNPINSTAGLPPDARVVPEAEGGIMGHHPRANRPKRDELHRGAHTRQLFDGRPREPGLVSGVEAKIAPPNPPNNDFVQNWLVQTQRRPDWESVAKVQPGERLPWRPHNLGGVNLDMPPPPAPRLLKRRRPMSFDSSFIPENHKRPQRHDLASNLPPALAPSQNSDISPGMKEGSPNRPLGSVGSSPRPKQSFDRRPRHKTREDRYEIKKNKRGKRNSGGADKTGKSQSAKRTKRSDKKTLVSSREVMSAFTSDAILTHDRLTV